MAEKQSGLTQIIIGSILRWLLWILLAGFLVLLIVSVAQLFLGQAFVLTYLKQLLLKNIDCFNYIKSTWLINNPVAFIETVTRNIEENIWQGLHLQDGLTYLKELQDKQEAKNPFTQSITHRFPLLLNYIETLITAIQIFAVRIFIILMYLPLFWLLGLVASIDGLTQRHLRKLQGARESSLIYHRANSALLPCFIVSNFLYLLIPIPINPTIWFLTFAVLFSMALTITVSAFKKYL